VKNVRSTLAKIPFLGGKQRRTGTESCCFSYFIGNSPKRIDWEFNEPKEHVIAKPVRRLVVAIPSEQGENPTKFRWKPLEIATSGFALLAMTCSFGSLNSNFTNNTGLAAIFAASPVGILSYFTGFIPSARTRPSGTRA
jgi:hypothetical protein